MKFSRILEPQVAGTPFMHRRSFTPTGTPSSGFHSPPARRLSASRAAARASPSKTVR